MGDGFIYALCLLALVALYDRERRRFKRELDRAYELLGNSLDNPNVTQVSDIIPAQDNNGRYLWVYIRFDDAGDAGAFRKWLRTRYELSRTAWPADYAKKVAMDTATRKVHP